MIDETNVKESSTAVGAAKPAAGAMAGAFTPASMSILPDILKDEELQAGNAMNMASAQGAYLIGSAIAGVVVGMLTAGVGLLVDGATFVVSAITLALMGMGSFAA